MLAQVGEPFEAHEVAGVVLEDRDLVVRWSIASKDALTTASTVARPSSPRARISSYVAKRPVWNVRSSSSTIVSLESKWW